MNVKINLIQKSFYISFLLIIIIIASLFIDIPFRTVVLLTDTGLLILLTTLQLLEIRRVKGLLLRTSDILSQGNERDFSSLKEKEKNIINYKITNLIEQLEDSVKQSTQILDEKEKLTAQIEDYKSAIKNFRNTLSRNVIDIKNRIVDTTGTIESLLMDFSVLKKSCETEGYMLSSLLDLYSSYVNNYSKIHQSIEQSKHISDRETRRTELILDTVSSLYDRTESSEEQMSTIFRGIENIRDVTDIINEVAEKASILSLNAAIESAHAGEAGKGFAVVAEEVGVLADTTAEHAENINEALFSVSDLINETKREDENNYDSYPDLISDIKEINKAFITINELLSIFSATEKPEQFNISEAKAKDRDIVDSSISILQNMKTEMELSIEKIGQIALLQPENPDRKKTDKILPIEETSVKPVKEEISLDIE